MVVRRIAACLVVALGGAIADGAAEPERLPEGIARAAEHVVAVINAEGYGTVGVLKFRVRKQGGDAGETAGTINRDVAALLETALVLKRKREASFLLVAGASDTAAAIPGAGDATPEGRDALFGGRYRPAWGDQSVGVPVDAFVTGVIDVDPGLERMRVTITALDHKQGPREICAFDAAVEPALLAPLGESFATRGVLNAGLAKIPRKEQEETAPTPVPVQPIALDAASIRDGKKPHPFEDAAGPAILVVAYDGVEVPLVFRDGRAFVPEPRAGQKVSISVRKRDRDGRRIGVVLKVNGENTALRQRAPDLGCYKWILSDSIPTVTVFGYQTDQEAIEPFAVLSAGESRRREFDYGSDVGTISLTVFDDESSAAAPAPPAEVAGQPDPADVALLERGVRVDSVAARPTPQQLREALVDDPSAPSRGLIVGSGTTEKRKLDIVEFRPVPTPVMAAVVTYYTPRPAGAP